MCGPKRKKRNKFFIILVGTFGVGQLMAVRGLVCFFPSPPRDFYVTSSRAGRTCFCGRMVCISCADSLDVCPLITLPSFICLLLFFSFLRSLVVLVFPSSWHLPTCHETAGDDGLQWKTTTTTTTIIIIIHADSIQA